MTPAVAIAIGSPHLRPAFVPLLLLFLLLAGATSSQHAGAQHLPPAGDYKSPRRPCAGSFTQSTCLAPPTVKGLDLKAYLGKWYEIGSTARFKLGTESGLACVFANYSLPEPSSSRASAWGDNITVVNTGLQVLGTVASAGIREVGQALSGACAAARNICSSLAPTAGSPIEDVLAEIRALSAELTKTDKLTLSSGVTATERTLQLLQAITDGVADTLGRISMKAGDVSQRVGDTPSYFSVVQLRDQVQRLMSTTARAKNIVTHLRAQTDAVSVAKSLLATSPTRFTGQAFRLMLAYIKLGRQENAIALRLAELDLLLESVVDIGNEVIVRDTSKPLSYYSLTGFAERKRGEDASKLQVYFPLPQGLTGGPYWVVDIVGEASDGYEAALVYSCQELPSGGIDPGIFILSRTPTLPSTVVDRFLAKAESFGFRFSCDNRFILTVQNHPSCKQ